MRRGRFQKHPSACLSFFLRASALNQTFGTLSKKTSGNSRDALECGGKRQRHAALGGDCGRGHADRPSKSALPRRCRRSFLALPPHSKVSPVLHHRSHSCAFVAIRGFPSHRSRLRHLAPPLLSAAPRPGLGAEFPTQHTHTHGEYHPRRRPMGRRRQRQNH